jgi:serine/threonine protein phosphatase PrpC
MKQQQQHQQEWQEQDKWNMVSALLLSSAFATLGFATATTSSPGAGAVSTGKTATTAKAKFGRGGSGPGSNKPFSSTYTASSRENAEEDVRRLELESNEQPYMVRKPTRQSYREFSFLQVRFARGRLFVLRIFVFCFGFCFAEQVSVGALQGARWTMEDEYKIANGGRFAAVFDGHGGNGVSRALRERLFDTYGDLLCRKHWEELDETANRGSRTPSISSHVAALRGAFAQVNDEVMAQHNLENQGSTAVAVVTHISETGHRTLLSANVGDSRAILSRKGRAMELTRDHKPNDERERARIMALGEVVEWDSYSQVHRVRSLSLSRAIGDKFAGPAVSAEADIRHFPVDDDDDEFILLASDGLWDVMSSQEVVDFVHECMNEGLAHKSLSKEERDTLKFVQARSMGRIVANEALERGSPDNVCVLVVWLGDRSIKN